jgi:hypothetical protein
MDQSEEKIAVELTAKQWRTIQFLAIRGATSEYEAELRRSSRHVEIMLRKADELLGRPPRVAAHRHDEHCYKDFADIVQALTDALTPSIPELQQPRETPQPHPTSPIEE